MRTFLATQQSHIRELFHAAATRDEGQDMIEYALLAALISIVAIAMIILVGPYITDLFGDVVNGLSAA
ncbi:MAG: Flp family type IVb pilin [Chloroflexota bacterium]